MDLTLPVVLMGEDENKLIEFAEVIQIEKNVFPEVFKVCIS